MSAKTDPYTIPPNLPAPQDDGACAHLLGMSIPHPVLLNSTRSRLVDVKGISSASRVVFFFYPMTGKPGVALPRDWNLIPGARGCTPESCSYRDLYSEFKKAGSEVYGISSQSTEDQIEFSTRSSKVLFASFSLLLLG